MSRDREEFKKGVTLAAWQRANGHCEKCTAKLFPGKFHFDHRIPCGIGGEATLENCQVLCLACHDVKTRKEDIPLIAKAKRVWADHIGAKAPSKRPMACGKNSPWRKRMDGSVVPRDLNRTVLRAYRPLRSDT